MCHLIATAEATSLYPAARRNSVSSSSHLARRRQSLL